MKTIEEKYKDLQEYIKSLGSVAVAYSGGVDSTFLLKVAHDILGDRAIAITVVSHSFPKREIEEAVFFCRKQQVVQRVLEMDELAIKGFAENPVNRCYICKKEIFTNIQNEAAKYNIVHVVEGSNIDDNRDYRPGHKAIAELNVISPLRQAGLCKKEIRELSRKLDLPTWEKPSFACLATRFVYGETITREKLQMVDKAEQLLWDMGFSQVRVRIHGLMARIEVAENDIVRMVDLDVRSHIVNALKEYGFTYVSLDLSGYRMGSMNETL